MELPTKLNTELLDKIKDEVAKELGYSRWENFLEYKWPEVCRRYAIEVNKDVNHAVDNLLAVMHSDGGHL